MKKPKPSEVQPVVCSVGSNYEICIPTDRPALLRVRIGESDFFCDDNGVRKSGDVVQKFRVPTEILDKEQKYTVFRRILKQRKAYFSTSYDEESFSFSFRPVLPGAPVRAAHLSDVHGLKDAAVRTGAFFGEKPDLLILNGDISSSSATEKEILLPLEIAYALTSGERPCIITRGNHDLRGKLAEKLSTYYPTDYGNTFYVVNLPGWSFIILDCGEDKRDTDPEYGYTTAFHNLRMKQTDFLRRLADSEDPLFCANKKIVLSHIPFMYLDNNPKFVIEQELYGEWCRILREKIRPVFGLFGHVHRLAFYPAGDPYDNLGFGSPVILGGAPVRAETSNDVKASFLTLTDRSANIEFSDGSHIVSGSYTVE